MRNLLVLGVFLAACGVDSSFAIDEPSYPGASRHRCGWEYYYGHMDRYSSDINPFNLLKATSASACAAPAPPPPAPRPPPAGCGRLVPGQQLSPGQTMTS